MMNKTPKDGLHTEKPSLGIESIGRYENGIKVGTWVTTQNKIGFQLKTTGNYNSGLKEGTWTTLGYDERKIIEVEYKKGKESGTSVSWHSNGQKKSECFYKNGKKDGIYTAWHKTGFKSYTEEYKNDIPCGEWVKWYGDSVENKTYFYKNGKPKYSVSYDLIKLWNKDGSKKEIRISKDYTTENSWYKNGDKRLIIATDKDSRIFRETSWYENRVRSIDEIGDGLESDGIKGQYENGEIKFLIEYWFEENVLQVSQWNKSGQQEVNETIQMPKGTTQDNWRFVHKGIPKYDILGGIPKDIIEEHQQIVKELDSASKDFGGYSPF